MPVALHCVGARHPIVYVALVVRGRAVHVRVRRRAVEVRSGRVGTAYERPDKLACVNSVENMRLAPRLPVTSIE